MRALETLSFCVVLLWLVLCCLCPLSKRRVVLTSHELCQGIWLLGTGFNLFCLRGACAFRVEGAGCAGFEVEFWRLEFTGFKVYIVWGYTYRLLVQGFRLSSLGACTLYSFRLQGKKQSDTGPPNGGSTPKPHSNSLQPLNPNPA